MKRTAAFVSVVFTSLALTGTTVARQLKGHRQQARMSLTQPDQVIQWNQEMLQLLQAPGAQPATIHPTRTMATTQLAVYDAVNAIERQNEPYVFHERASRDASPDAAAASAARTSLLALLPSQQRRSRKVVGVGSVGTDDAIVLLRGDSDRDLLFLQVKEAQASVLERFAELEHRASLIGKRSAVPAHHDRRVDTRITLGQMLNQRSRFDDATLSIDDPRPGHLDASTRRATCVTTAHASAGADRRYIKPHP